ASQGSAYQVGRSGTGGTGGVNRVVILGRGGTSQSRVRCGDLSGGALVLSVLREDVARGLALVVDEVRVVGGEGGSSRCRSERGWGAFVLRRDGQCERGGGGGA